MWKAKIVLYQSMMMDLRKHPMWQAPPRIPVKALALLVLALVAEITSGQTSVATSSMSVTLSTALLCLSCLFLLQTSHARPMARAPIAVPLDLQENLWPWSHCAAGRQEPVVRLVVSSPTRSLSSLYPPDLVSPFTHQMDNTVMQFKRSWERWGTNLGKHHWIRLFSFTAPVPIPPFILFSRLTFKISCLHPKLCLSLCLGLSQESQLQQKRITTWSWFVKACSVILDVELKYVSWDPCMMGFRWFHKATEISSKYYACAFFYVISMKQLLKRSMSK